MSPETSDRRRDLLLITLPLSILAVLISIIAAGAVYLELSEQTTTNRKLINDAAELAVRVAQVQQGREDARTAANQAQLEQCYQRNATGPALRRLLGAVREGLNPDGQAIVDAFIEENLENTPTIRDCNELEDSLELPRQRS